MNRQAARLAPGTPDTQRGHSRTGPQLSAVGVVPRGEHTSQGLGKFIRQADAFGVRHSYRGKCGNPGGADYETQAAARHQDSGTAGKQTEPGAQV
jgi:hypothetical protein